MKWGIRRMSKEKLKPFSPFLKYFFYEKEFGLFIDTVYFYFLFF
jgi:hypothetical protein